MIARASRSLFFLSRPHCLIRVLYILALPDHEHLRKARVLVTHVALKSGPFTSDMTCLSVLPSVRYSRVILARCASQSWAVG